MKYNLWKKNKKEALKKKREDELLQLDSETMMQEEIRKLTMGGHLFGSASSNRHKRRGAKSERVERNTRNSKEESKRHPRSSPPPPPHSVGRSLRGHQGLHGLRRSQGIGSDEEEDGIVPRDNEQLSLKEMERRHNRIQRKKIAEQDRRHHRIQTKQEQYFPL